MLTGLLIFLLLIVALFAIPIGFEFSVDWPDGGQNEFILVWALGLVRVRLPIGDSVSASKADGNRTGREKRRRRKPTGVLAAVRQRPFRRRLYRFACDLWNAVNKEDMRIRARIGLGDPADTGRLWALVGPVSGTLVSASGGCVVIEPDFVDAAFEFDGSGKLRIVPLKVIAISIGMLFSPALWRGLRVMREG